MVRHPSLKVRRRNARGLWTFEEDSGQLYFLAVSEKFRPVGDNWTDDLAGHCPGFPAWLEQPPKELRW